MEYGIQLKHSLTLFTLLAGLAGASFSVSAEEADDGPVHELPPQYVMVSTRTPISLERASPSVELIDSEEMEFWQDRGLFDVISRESGLALARNGSVGSVGSLFIRGTESRHTAVLLDGRRLNPGLANQFDLEHLTVDNLSSVQLMKGASSVIYGLSGIGGVIDLRTDSAFDSTDFGHVSHEFGSNDYVRTSGGLDYVGENWGTSLELSALSTENERVNDDYESSSLTHRLDFNISDRFALEFVGRYTDTEKKNPGSVFNPSSFAYGETENWLLSPGFRYSTDDLSVHFFYSRSELKFEGVNDFGGAFPFLSSVDSDEFSLQVDLSLGENMLLTAGANHRVDEPFSSNNASYDTEFKQTGAFLQLIAVVSDSLELRGGLRADEFSEYDDVLTGNLEVIYTIEDWQTGVFAKVANSFSPPTGQDLIFDGDPVTTPVNPEESVSYELGVRKSFDNQQLEIEMVYFRNEIDDLIDFVFDSNTSVFDGFNIDEALTEGVEAGFDYQLNESFFLSGSYTYLTAENETTDERLEKRPRHTIQLSAEYAVTDDVSLGVNATTHVDRIGFNNAVLKDFSVVNLVGSWAVSEEIDVFVRINNLFDKGYELSAGYPSLRRAGYIGARYTF